MEKKRSDVVNFNDPSEKPQKVRTAKIPVGGAPMPNIPPLDSPAAKHNDPTKLLTPEQIEQLQAQGKFIPGAGSAYVTNQPPLEEKSNEKEFVNPPRSEGGISKETLDQLKDMERGIKEAEREEEDELRDEFGNRVRNELVNAERRKIIESRCKDMDITDLLINQEIRQTVPIISKKFEPTFRSVSGSEDLFIKQLIGEDKTGTDRYILDKFSMMNLCAGLLAINGHLLPSHLDKDGNPTTDLFNKKFEVLSRYPMTILSDLGINYHWFDKRVRKLLSVENIQDF